MRRANTNRSLCGAIFRPFVHLPRRLEGVRGDIGDGLWIALIGFFLDNAAAAQLQQGNVQGLLEGHKVSQAMSSQCPAVPGI